MSLTASIERRQDGLFQPATAYDAELLGSLKAGKPYKVEVKQMSNRSYQHHKLFFGGLLPLAFQYWQPTGGMLTQAEQQTVMQFAQWLDALTGNDDHAFADLAQDFLTRLSLKRAQELGQPASCLEQFRKWLTVEAGYFDMYEIPGGIRKEAKSISFHSMSQEEFNVFYQDCFNVVWNMMLNAVFDSEESAQQAAVQKMMELG